MADPAVEHRRLSALYDFAVLDTAPESDFDDIAVLAAQLCRTPSAAVSLVAGNRQWLKARVGIDSCETSRKHSFCAHAMLRDEVMQVPDARLDERFRANPSVLAPFRRAAAAELAEVPGAGLGLSIVKAIIDSHGGGMAIDSEPGCGTTVTVTLPRHGGQQPDGNRRGNRPAPLAADSGTTPG